MSSQAFITGPPRLRRGQRRAQCALRTPVMTERPIRPLKASRTVIVGAGPAGLSTALMLAELGFQDLTILERSLRPTSQARTRGYSFALLERGLKLLRLLPGVMDRILARASASPERKIILVREDDTKEFDTPLNINFPIWILRGELMVALQDTLAARHPDFEIRWGAHVVGIEAQKDGGARIKFVDAEAEDGENVVHADFVVACDGAWSAVRAALEGKGDVLSSKGFELHKAHSAAVGLSFRAISTVESPVVKLADGETIPMNSHASYVLYGHSKVPTHRRFNFGFQPVGPDPSSVRDAVVILKPEHELWKVKDVDECYKCFDETFPYLRIRELFSRESVESFVSAKVGSFPSIQRSMSLVGHFANEAKHGANDGSASGGVVLLGDAAHAFPPDLGQGVNSALEDIFVLKNTIEACTENDTVNDVLQAYEQRRNEDVWALMYIMKYGNPYQYRQSVWGNRRALANILLRSKLTKIAPGFFYPSIAQCFVDDIPYREFWRRSQVTTRRIWGVVIILVLSLTACLNLLS